MGLFEDVQANPRFKDLSPEKKRVALSLALDEDLKVNPRAQGLDPEMLAKQRDAYLDEYLDPGFLSNVGSLAIEGAKRTAQGLRLSGDVATGKIDENTPKLIADALKDPGYKPPELKKAQEHLINSGVGWEEAEGFTQSAKALASMFYDIGKEAITNPKGLAYFTAEQAGNMAPTLAGMLAGGKTGAILGTVAAPGPGTAIGAATGAVAGAFGGGWAVEAGLEFPGYVAEALAQKGLELTEENIRAFLADDEGREAVISMARRKATGTAGVDALMTVAGGKIAGQAMKATTIPRRVAGLAAGGGVEVIGEPVSEAAGQLAATGKVDMGDVAMETFGGLGGAAIEVPAAIRATRAGRQDTGPTIPDQEDPLEFLGRLEAGLYSGDITPEEAQMVAPRMGISLEQLGTILKPFSAESVLSKIQASLDAGALPEEIRQKMPPGLETQVEELLGQHDEKNKLSKRLNDLEQISQAGSIDELISAAQESIIPSEESYQKYQPTPPESTPEGLYQAYRPELPPQYQMVGQLMGEWEKDAIALALQDRRRRILAERQKLALPPPAGDIFGEGFTARESAPQTIIRKAPREYVDGDFVAGVDQSPKVVIAKPFKTLAGAKLALKSRKLVGYDIFPTADGKFQIRTSSGEVGLLEKKQVAAAKQNENDSVINADPIVSMVSKAQKDGGILLSVDVQTTYGPETIGQINKRFPGLFRKTGKTQLDELAETEGFESADALVELLKGAKTKQQRAEAAAEPEIGQDVDAMQEKGFEPVYGKKPVAEFDQGDEIITSGKDGVVPADTYKVKGRDAAGNVILKDGVTIAVDDFDVLDVEGVKRGEVSGKAEILPLVETFNRENNSRLIYQGPQTGQGGSFVGHTFTDADKNGPTQGSTFIVTEKAPSLENITAAYRKTVDQYRKGADLDRAKTDKNGQPDGQRVAIREESGGFKVYRVKKEKQHNSLSAGDIRSISYFISGAAQPLFVGTQKDAVQFVRDGKHDLFVPTRDGSQLYKFAGQPDGQKARQPEQAQPGIPTQPQVEDGDKKQDISDDISEGETGELPRAAADKMDDAQASKELTPDELGSLTTTQENTNEKGNQEGQGRRERLLTEKAPDAATTKSGADRKLEDFGEKLGGAKKDRVISLDVDLADADIAAQPFSRIWPKSEVDSIEDKPLAAIATAIRAEVPTKPRDGYKLSRWVERVKGVRELMRQAEQLGHDTFMGKMADRSPLKPLIAKINLLEQIDREHWGRIGAAQEYPDAYHYSKDGNKIASPSSSVVIDGRHRTFRFGNISEALPEIEKELAGKQAARKMQFEVRGKDGSFFINKKGDPLYRKLKTFDDSKAALEFRNANHDALVMAWEEVKASDNIQKDDVRRKDNRPRVGSDHRKGKDATPEMFIESLGFRGVEFGNWVSQGKNTKERQGMLNAAYDALMDLANIIGVPPRAISLNGTLGLGLGSRGSGSASAHYESDMLVINLTKTRGAGSLGHEFFHALDNYFARSRGEAKFAGNQESYRKESFITYKPEPMYVNKKHGGSSLGRARLTEMRLAYPDTDWYNAKNWVIDPNHPEGVRPEVEESFADLVEALDASPMAKRSRLIDKGKSGYWSRIIERSARAFENYIIAKMQEGGYHNDYLANVKSIEEWSKDPGRYPYLLAEELSPVAEAFDNLFSTLKTKETDKGTMLFSQSTDLYSPTQEEAEEVQSAIEGKSVEEAAAFIAGNATDPEKRIIAEKVLSKIKEMQNLGIKFNLNIAHRHERVPEALKGTRGFSYTKPGWEEVDIWLQGADVTGYVGTSYETALHELVHAVTQVSVAAGRDGQKDLRPIVKELDDVVMAIVKHVRDRFENNRETLTSLEMDILNLSGRNNMLDSHEEVLAWGLSSRKFQEYLDTIPYESGTMWTRFITAIRNFLGLGEKQQTALSGLLKVSESLFDTKAEWSLGFGGEVINTAKGELINSQTEQGFTPEQIQAHADKVTSGWKNAPKITTVNSVADLPAHLKDYIASDSGTGSIEGVFVPGHYVGLDKPMSPESLPDSSPSDIKKFVKFSETKAFLSQGFGSLDIERQRVMMRGMVALFHNREVFDAVIEAIPVDVMNQLSGKKFSPERLLSGKGMLAAFIFPAANAPVSGRINVAARELRSSVARTGTIIKALAERRGETGDDFTAAVARDFNSGRATVPGLAAAKDSTARWRARPWTFGPSVEPSQVDFKQPAANYASGGDGGYSASARANDFLAFLEAVALDVERFPASRTDSFDHSKSSLFRTLSENGRWVNENIYLIADAIENLDRIPQVVLHESFGHYGLRGVMGLDISPVLVGVYNAKRAEAQDIAKKYGLDLTKAADRQLAAEEVLAGLAQDPANHDLDIMRRAVAAVRSWIRKKGFDLRMTDNDIRALIARSARFVKKGTVKESLTVGQFAQDAKMSLKDATKKITDSQAFVKWFGDSKVVDDNGDPLVVYHGTTAEINKFDLAYLGEKSGHPTSKLGFYFVEDPGEAATYTEKSYSNKTALGGNIIPAYLSVKNPYEIDASEFVKLLESGRPHQNTIESTIDDAVDYFTDEGYRLSASVGMSPGDIQLIDDEGYAVGYDDLGENLKEKYDELVDVLAEYNNFDFRDLFGDKEASRKMSEKRGSLINEGYDGIIIEPDFLQGDEWPELRHKTFIVFAPTQIKSIYNRGTFDPADSRIMFSRTDQDEQIEKVMKRLESLYNAKGISAAKTKRLIDRYETLIQTLKDDKKDIYAKQSALERHIKENLPKEERWRVLPIIKNIAKPTTAAGRERMLQKAIEKVEEAHQHKQKVISDILSEKDIADRRRKSIRAIRDYLGLTDDDLRKISRKDIRLMSNIEFKQFKDDLMNKAIEFADHRQAKLELMDIVYKKRLQRVENFQQAMGLPPISQMTKEQLNQFADTLSRFEVDDVFMGKRTLEVVDRVDYLKGIRTWREAKEKIAVETGMSIEDLSKVKIEGLDHFRWDTSLAERDPFLNLLVSQTAESIMGAQIKYHGLEEKFNALMKKARQGKGLVDRLIPQDKIIFDYLEAPAEMKDAVAEKMTPAELDVAYYMQEYFGEALEYLVATKSLQTGRENYITHIRRSFLETWKDDGLIEAFKGIFKNYEQDQMVFNILDDDTGTILPMEKFFQFSLRRTGELVPSKNVTKIFLSYARIFEKKKALDALIPKMEIYTQALTPQVYTPTGMEADQSLKKFVHQWINNKKGRKLSFNSAIRQGGAVDLGINAMRTFTTLLDLGLNIPVSVAALVGEQVSNYAMLGTKNYAKGTARMQTTRGKLILMRYKAFTGRSAWEEFTEPGKEVTERLGVGLFGLFHQSTVIANKQFLLGSLTKDEFNSGKISEKRLAELQLEMGRFRQVPGTSSLVGSTSLGGAFTQYKKWAVPIVRTTAKDISTLAQDLKKSPGKALTTKEAKELYRIIGITSTAIIVGMMVAAEDDDDSFLGQIKAKAYRESTTLLQGIDPKLWLSTPRVLTFLAKLGDNLHSLVMLEEYKKKDGYKGVEGLKRQFTPRATKTIMDAITKEN